MSDKDIDIAGAIRNLGGDILDLPFWEACRDGRFLLHRCNVCGRHYWPASRCVVHGAQSMAWLPASGRGTLYTYTVMHHAYTPTMKGKTPYVVAVIRLDEGPYFHSNLIDCTLDQVRIGMQLQSAMIEQDNGLVVPVFRPTFESQETTA
ncbi:MAG TPA: OB-fold domain-containing protein [Solimonas sp.]